MRRTQINSSQALSLCRARDRGIMAQAGGFFPHSGNQVTVTAVVTRMSESGHAASE